MQQSALTNAQGRSSSTNSNSGFACIVLQDAAFIEQQRQMVYSAASASGPKDEAHLHAAEVPVNTPVKGEDYQRLKQWKDAVGAPTFSQLHTRRDRLVPIVLQNCTVTVCMGCTQ